jgi:DNA-directed RNA polymerase subunit RPC12/RpoP
VEQIENMQPANFRSLALSNHPLLVRCRSCKHRAVVTAEAIGATPHSMESIEKPRLKCKTCGSRDIERKITYGAPSVEEWLSEDGL